MCESCCKCQRKTPSMNFLKNNYEESVIQDVQNEKGTCVRLKKIQGW